jgi:hypothetical protein
MDYEDNGILDVMSHILVGKYPYYRGTCCLHPEDGGSRFF